MNVRETWYVYVSKGPLLIGEIKFWGKVAREEGGGCVWFSLSAPEQSGGKFE